jgi:hypothetical protein
MVDGYILIIQKQKMKKLTILFFVLTGAICSFAQSSKPKMSHSKSDTVAKYIYTCPMHPEVIKDKPGNCPKCGMKLVEKKPAPSTKM